MCGCTTLTVRQGLLSTHVHPDRESIVRRHAPRHEEIFSTKRLHVLSFAQDEALEYGVRHLHFEVDSIDLGIPERTEVKVELSEPGRSRHRSEERRVGKECRCGWSRYDEKKKDRIVECGEGTRKRCMGSA